MTNFGSMQNRKQSKYQPHQLFRSDKGQRWVHCPTFAQALKMPQGALVLFPNVRKMFDSNSYNLPG